MATTKRPTQVLKEEHEEVILKLKALENIFNRLEKQSEITGALRELTSFFKTDFWVHFSKEEDVLFPELEKFMPRNQGPIGVMLEEHVELRNLNEEIQKLVPVYLNDGKDANTQAQLKRHGNRFIYTLRDHIDKENNVLFMMADVHLDKTQQQNILTGYDRIVQAYKAEQAGACDSCC
ncbi:MAG: hemerythrin domain-containing protein [Chloroflexi bacterium]|nr:hemerythrin domain-containing protein [Chloroflexota bacterium]